MRQATLILAVFGLAACGATADAPENIPLRGKWRKDVTLTRVTVNGLTLDREQLPISLPPDHHEELGCMEPALRTLADLNQTIADATESKCRLETLDHDGGTIKGAGRCGYKVAEADVGGILALAGEEQRRRISTRLTIDVFVHGRSGATEQVRVSSAANWERLGDC